MLRFGDTGDWLGTFEGHKGAVWGVALNNSASLAASGAADFTAKIWNAVSGEEAFSFQHNHIVKSVAFDRASQYLVTGSNEKLIKIFDLDCPNANSICTFIGHAGNLKRAIFCRNEKCIASIAEDKTLRIWDKTSMQEVQRIELSSFPNSLVSDNFFLDLHLMNKILNKNYVNFCQ